MHPLKFPVTMNSKSTKSTAKRFIMTTNFPYSLHFLWFNLKSTNSKLTVMFKVYHTSNFVQICTLNMKVRSKLYYTVYPLKIITFDIIFLISRITPALMDHHCQDVTVKTIILLLPLIGIPAHQPWLSIPWISTKFWLM